MVEYYDIILGLIPVTLLGLAGLLYGIGITPAIAVPAAAAVAACLVGHAMFVRSPVPESPREHDGVHAAD